MGTSFCLTGKMMDKTTFTDSSLLQIISKFEIYYFDLERTDTLMFNDTTFTKQPIQNYPLHSLGMRFSKGRFSIPGVVILDEKNQILEMLNFYYSPQQIKPILEYFGENEYKKKSWDDFIRNYSLLKSSKTPDPEASKKQTKPKERK